ncbi:hypothetical protein CDD83_2677 [Cordyceps sp. RAO-2017]|nr:hypothetical protein CDD83_2677 [Cordyceps sp. RAO-2017]
MRNDGRALDTEGASWTQLERAKHTLTHHLCHLTHGSAAVMTGDGAMTPSVSLASKASPGDFPRVHPEPPSPPLPGGFTGGGERRDAEALRYASDRLALLRAQSGTEEMDLPDRLGGAGSQYSDTESKMGGPIDRGSGKAPSAAECWADLCRTWNSYPPRPLSPLILVLPSLVQQEGRFQPDKRVEELESGSGT